MERKQILKYREEADYNPSYVFTEEDFAGLKKRRMSCQVRYGYTLKRTGFC